MDIPFYLFPLSFAIVAFLTTFATFYLILLPEIGLFAKASPQLISQLDNLDDQLLQNEITPLLEEKIDEFLIDLTGQIPMGSMILSGSLGKSIKGKAKAAVLAMVPDLKKKGLEKAQEMALQKQQELWKKVLWNYGGLLALFSGAFGALLGVLLALYIGKSN